MNERIMFLEGVKPAILIREKQSDRISGEVKTSKIFSELVEKEYPYILFPHRNSALFFQDEVGLGWFEVNGLVCEYSTRLEKWIQDYKHDVLGYALGYPPRAVESWWELSVTKVPRILVNYYGIQFVTKEENWRYDVEWLKEYRPVPEYIEKNGIIFAARLEVVKGRLQREILYHESH